MIEASCLPYFKITSESSNYKSVSGTICKDKFVQQ